MRYVQMQSAHNTRLLTQAGWTQQATADWFGVDDRTIRRHVQMHIAPDTRLLTQAGWTTADWLGVAKTTLVGELQMQTTNTRLLTDAAYLSACQLSTRTLPPSSRHGGGLTSAGRGIPIA